MMKRGKKVLGMVLAFAVLVGCNAATVKAATTSAYLQELDTKVTVTYSDAKSSTIAYLSGCKTNWNTGETTSFTDQRSTTATGNVTFVFNAGTCYKYNLDKNGQKLTVTIYVGGTKTDQTLVTRQ